MSFMLLFLLLLRAISLGKRKTFLFFSPLKRRESSHFKGVVQAFAKCSTVTSSSYAADLMDRDGESRTGRRVDGMDFGSRSSPLFLRLPHHFSVIRLIPKK